MSNPVRKRIKELALEGEVILAGYQNPVQPFYEAMDILVSPSYTEGLSNVILEALAYKLPVIATHVGGNSEIITNGVDGILVENNSAPVLGEALSLLLSDVQIRRQYGERGYETVRNRFEFRNRVAKEQAFYDAIMRQKAGVT
jgi:glycosyltransferase involved in cell wall biosynthesis